MSRSNWVSWLTNRSLSQNFDRRRRRTPVLLGGVRDWLLEDRCLLSGGLQPSPNLTDPNQSMIYVDANNNGTTIGPYNLLHVAANPSDVIFLGGTNPNTGNFDWGNVPTKSVTFTNDSSNKQTIYPFLYSPNTNKIYDPIDATNDEYRLYIGYEQDGKYILGLPYGQSITINVPLVFWNGGRADIATDGANLIPDPDKVNSDNPFQFYYTASTYITTQGVDSSTDNGILMYYKANTPNQPTDPSPAAAGQLTEWTIRDKDFLSTVNTYDQNNKIGTIPSSELTTLINYDVSYVDDMLAPVAMTATQVPVPIQYIQLGTATQNGNTTTIQPNDSNQYATLLQLLGANGTYPYQTYQWQVKYNVPGSPTSIDVGTVTNVTDGMITVTNSQPVSGLPTNAAGYVFYTNSVTQNYGWTGANNDIVAMQNAMSAFTSNDPNANGLGEYFGGLGWPQYYNPNSNALLKIPSGASILVNSPLTTKTSPYDGNYFLLTSGNNGTRIQYNATETLANSDHSTNKGDTITLNVTGADLAAIEKQGGTWVLSTSLNTAASSPIAKIDSIDSINPDGSGTITVTLLQDIPNSPTGYSCLIVAPPTDPYATMLTNLWYSWANFYVQQLSSIQGLTISATVSADTDSSADTRVLTFAAQDQSLASQLMLGMAVTDNNTQQTATILKIVKNETNGVTSYTVYLSAPVDPGQPGQDVSFTFSKPAMIPYSNSVQTNLINPDGFGADKPFAIAFAASVYEMMSVYSTIPGNHTGLPNAMDLVYEAIGGNVGFLPTAAFVNISADVRDLGKSVLRGVPDFNLYPNQFTTDAQWQPGDWYPPPSKPTDGTDFNVFNLDPFVWFVHQKLGLSGYGFSFDDDAADIGAGGASALSVTFSSGPTVNPIQSQWFPSTPWGSVSAMATISQETVQNAVESILTIEPQDVKAFWQVFANDKNNSLVGAYVSSLVQGAIPPGTILSAALDSNKLQFELSTRVPTRTTPFLVTFTGFPPKSLSSSPSPPVSPLPSPPSSPLPPPPSSVSTGAGNNVSSSPSNPQEIASLVVNEIFLTLEQVLVLTDVAFGLAPALTLESSIAAHQNAINADPMSHTLLGQLLLQFVELEVLEILVSPLS